MSKSEGIIENHNDVLLDRFFDGSEYLMCVSMEFGFIKNKELRMAKDVAKEREGISFKSYNLKDISKKSMVSVDNLLAFNLDKIYYIIKDFKIDEIFIPNKLYPAYMRLDGGYNIILVPINLSLLPWKVDTVKLKENKTLRKFW